MPTHSTLTECRTEKLDVRVSSAAKAKLRAAASAFHRSMSDFVMESALSRAEEMLLERRIFALNAEIDHSATLGEFEDVRQLVDDVSGTIQLE